MAGTEGGAEIYCTSFLPWSMQLSSSTEGIVIFHPTLNSTSDNPTAFGLHGGEETVRYTRPVTCGHCHGTGAEPGTVPRTCPACAGTRQKVTTRGEQRGDTAVQFRQITICPQCAGRGKIIDHPCRECAGTGHVEREEHLCDDSAGHRGGDGAARHGPRPPEPGSGRAGR
jgi:hypothetical protein